MNDEIDKTLKRASETIGGATLITFFRLSVRWRDSILFDSVEDLTVIAVGASASNAKIRFIVVARDSYIAELPDALSRFDSVALLPTRVFADRDSARI